MQKKIRAVVLGKLRGHRAHNAQLVGHRADVGKNVADGEAALAVSLERPRRLESGAYVVELRRVDPGRERLAVILVEPRLGVERVHLRHAAIHVEEDDVPGTRLVVRFARRKRRPRFAVNRISQEAAQRHGTEAAGAAPQHLAAADRSRQEIPASFTK